MWSTRPEMAGSEMETTIPSGEISSARLVGPFALRPPKRNTRPSLSGTTHAFAIAARNRSENIEDMIANPPDLLVVDRESEYFDTPNFDWLAFMAEDPAWAAVFDDYAYVGKSNEWESALLTAGIDEIFHQHHDEARSSSAHQQPQAPHVPDHP